MQLSELVNFKNQLDSLSIVEEVRDKSNQELDKLTHLISNYGNQYQSDFIKNQQQLFQSYGILQQSLDTLKLQVKKDIEVGEKHWFLESYDVYNSELHSTAETILDLRQDTFTDISVYQSRLRVHADWRHPAMIIRPGRETFIQDMTMFDPLYLVDANHELLLPSLSRFPNGYKNRLRSYTVKEDLDSDILYRLPDNQFGLVFAYNYFNFRPFELLKKYFAEIFIKLKPGGIFILTFNDCDRACAVRLVEKYFACYTPGYLVKELAQSIGFQIEYSFYHNENTPGTWLELRKPGSSETLKGGQTLGKIIPK